MAESADQSQLQAVLKSMGHDAEIVLGSVNEWGKLLA